MTTSAGVVRPDEAREKELLLCTSCSCCTCAAARSPWLASPSRGALAGVVSVEESPSRSSRSRCGSSERGSEETGCGIIERINHSTDRNELPYWSWPDRDLAILSRSRTFSSGRELKAEEACGGDPGSQGRSLVLRGSGDRLLDPTAQGKCP